MPLSTYQKQPKLSAKKNQTKLFKIGIWVVALLLATSGLSAGYTMLTQAFGSEDKASAVELCRFGSKNVTDFDQMRTVTTAAGTHIFLQSNVTYRSGGKEGFIAFKENVAEDPCLGVSSITTQFNGTAVTDLSVHSWNLHEWEMMNAVFVPNLYEENNDDGYIAVFLREKTTNYTKKLSLTLLRYSDGQITFERNTELFDNNANFSSIINAHYSYNVATLYILGTTQSEGIKGRGMHLASISYEDLILGNGSYYYCNPNFSLQTKNNCAWTTDVNKSKAVIATKNGQMDVVGLDDNLSLLLQNNGTSVTVYDLASDGALWNPGLQLLNCQGTTNCDQISVYDYQMSMFENEEEKVKVLTFNFIQSYNGQAILYEAVINDFTVANTSAVASLPSISIKTAAAMLREDKVGVAARPLPSSKVLEKTRALPPRVESSRSTLSRSKSDKDTVSNEYIVEKKERKTLGEAVRNAVQGKKPVVTTSTVKTEPIANSAPQTNKGKDVVVTRVEQTVITNSASRTNGLTGGRTAGKKAGSGVIQASASPKNGINTLSSGAARGGTITPKVTTSVPTEGYNPSVVPTETIKPTKTPSPTPKYTKDTCTSPAKWVCEGGSSQLCYCDTPYVPPLKTPSTIKPSVKATQSVAATTPPLVQTQKSCPYGAMTEGNKTFCIGNHEACAKAGTGLNCSNKPLKYAAYQKCISGDTVTSCCPAGTKIENEKCVQYADLEAKDANGNKIERCKYGSIAPEDKAFCEAAIQKCDQSPDGDGLDCSGEPLKYPGFIKCRTTVNKIRTCCAKGSVNVNGVCKKGTWVYPAKCYTNGKLDATKCNLQTDGKYQYQE